MKKQATRIHIPVLAKELLSNLQVKPNGTYVDCTAGFGGHSSLILSQLTTGKLICIDQDDNAIAALNKLFISDKRVHINKDNFVNLDKIVNEPVDGIIMDLGVSSLMFDDPKRGFSYKLEGPLDMRMDQKQDLTAAYIVNKYSRAQLIDIFNKYGEVRNAKAVVDAIARYRDTKEIETTLELADIIADCFPGSYIRKHPAKTYFQALRIEVNKELDVLTSTLDKAIKLLKPKGRLAVITFHSLEDRIVKQLFKQLTEVKDLYGKESPISKLTKPQFKLITKKPITPSLQELQQNRRSHSAKLRIIEKI